MAGTWLIHVWGQMHTQWLLRAGMARGAVLLSLLESKKTTNFSNCCLLALEKHGDN